MDTILNTVYNNYMTTYAPKPLTRYDTHKKSELRSVYNSIVKYTKDAPWYLPTTSKETQHYAVSLKENARELRNTLAQLGGLESKELFSKKSAYSSDENVAAAAYIGSEEAAKDISDIELEVHSLATSQENLGLFLPDSRVALAPDTYSFDVGINNMNYEFQFSVGESETNRDVQERLVRLINNSDIGIQADLAESEGRTSLRLTSNSTGKNQTFTVTDSHTSKTAGTVDYFGLDYTSRESSDASFLINGEERTASANRFTLGRLFDVELKGTCEEGTPVRIGLKTDIESLTDNITHLIGGYNDFVKAANSYLETQSKSRQLIREMRGIAYRYNTALESMGLNMTEDGTLKVDQELLHETASQAQDITGTFGYLKDFSNSLIRKSNQVSLNPMEYVEKTVVAYKNPGHNFTNPYGASAYSGMMFNSYC